VRTTYSLTPEQSAALNNGKVIIFVRAQVDPKIVDRNLIVETNKFIEVKKNILSLNAGDMFLLDGAYYDVEYMLYTK
jgi:hypothetical protein